MPKKGQFKKGATEDSIRQRKYNSSEAQKKRRAERNASRATMVKAGKARKGDGKDVDHKNHNTADKSSKNLQTISRSKNRAMNQYDPRKKKK
ncbi:hypothetical protein D3C87_1418020 [compost metagenome]